MRTTFEEITEKKSNRFRCGLVSGQHDRSADSEHTFLGTTAKNSAHRICGMISSSLNLQSSRWETLALTRVERFSETTWTETQEYPKPSKLITSLLGTPAFNSCLFESSNFRAILCTWTLFHLSFCIPGLLEVSYIHVINPGNHFVMAVKRTSIREGLPKAAKLMNKIDGQHGEGLEPWTIKVGCHTSGSGMI